MARKERYVQQRQRQRRRQRRGGFTTVTVLFLVTLALLTVFVMANVSMSQIRLSTRGQARAIGLTIAEAGIDDTQDRLRLDPDYAGPASPVTLYEDPGTDSRPLGQFRVRVEAVDADRRRVRSEALRPDGTPMNVEVVAVVRIRRDGPVRGAIVANGDVEIRGSSVIKTHPLAGGGTAAVLSNGAIDVGGSGKEVPKVDGPLEAAGDVLGTDNGTFSPFRFRKDRPPVYFPSRATTDSWRAGWIAAAAAGTRVNPASEIKGGKVNTIQAPATIDGDLTINGNSTVVRLQADPNVSAERNVVYVTGDVTLHGNGARLINGVNLVVDGEFRQTGGSYAVGGEIADRWTPSLVVFGDHTSDPEDETVILNGNATVRAQGVVYALHGSIRLNGGATFLGALVAAQPGAQVLANGNYTHLFPDDMASLVRFVDAAEVESVVEL